MAIKVIYLQTAVEDLASIYKYISRDSVKYAKLEVQRIKAFADSLKNQPLSGKLYQTMHGKEGDRWYLEITLSIILLMRVR